jgi:hypothetical protein
VLSGQRERVRYWLYEVGDNEEHILPSNSEEVDDSELSRLTSDFDTIVTAREKRPQGRSIVSICNLEYKAKE